MTDEEIEEHLAVKIKYQGQCPYQKGHADNYFGWGLVIGIAISFGFWMILIPILGLHR